MQKILSFNFKENHICTCNVTAWKCVSIPWIATSRKSVFGRLDSIHTVNVIHLLSSKSCVICHLPLDRMHVSAGI